MLKNKKNRIISLVLTVALAGSVMAGCASKSSEPGKAGGAATSQQILRYNLGADPKTIDPGLNSSVEGGTVIVNAFEGLTNIDSKEQVVPGAAEKWDISPDGLKYTFYIRKDAKWSDGQPVKAQDFEYAWKRALDPDVASEYAYQLYYLKNGQKYNEKKANKDEVGVKAVNDTTLEVTLENSTPYFLSLTAFPTYMPLRQDIVEKDKEGWATKGETYIGNGPFKMKEWRPKDKMVFEKNPNYWNKDKVKLETIEYTLIDQETSYMSAFNAGQIDYIESPPTEQIPTLLANKTAQVFPYLGTYYYSFNISKDADKIDPAVAKVLKDVRVRKAISLAIDREALVKNVTKGGQNPATSFVPKGIAEAAGKDFKSKDYYKSTADVETAKKLLAEAGYPDGQGIPTLEILYNSGQGHQDIATAVQDMLKKNLGINVTLRNVERKVQLDETSNHKYPAIARNGWIADYADPMTFLDMWTSTSGNNVAGYNNPEYDKLIEQAKSESDSAKRMALMHQAEDILMNDMPIIPLYEYTNIACIKPYVKNVHKSPLGMVYFNETYIEK
ncbi:peptide ABC transporter substrate-binding protein [Clostridium sp. SYSU_GA19001]|uniref:peptide ABC transporter substrate-binding protein n=1 Tax=Clostridium caldaquaticum TaxID=2940653 RepID=UPI002077807C|nr:peptide ABC transporter substrate-binding protein [Clostridium caldaquaticum]MCM8711988.1 peptide ABC transporter substrate-binding protein [Clostridium caldaquaticum]